MGGNGSIFKTPWPNFDPKALETEEVEIVVQVNGKLRGRMRVAVNATEEELKDMILTDSDMKRWITGAAVKKFIVVAGKLVNIVI